MQQGASLSRRSLTVPGADHATEPSSDTVGAKDPSTGDWPVDQDREAPASKTASNKRQRGSESRLAYPRKRAATACQLCRARKTKCDNQRPSCSTCGSIGVECVYQNASTDLSTFDQASLTILDRVNYAVQILEHNSNLLAPLAGISNFQNLWPSSDLSLQSPGALHVLSPDDLFSNNATTLTEVLQVAANCASGCILSWPIFEGRINAEDITAAFYEPEVADHVRNSDPKATLTRNLASRVGPAINRGVREDNVPMLVQDFLNKVHIKNPILNAGDLTDFAREIAENGFKWDARSCLVMIACALANLASPFASQRPRPGESSSSDALDYPTAEAYYTGARKRTGLLDSSIMSAQCAFLIGVYEMYSLRPLRAWLSFNHACLTLQTCLQARSRQMISRAQKRLEQRLYWTCLKSECEMRDEIELPPTGLAKIDYPDVFPSPPGGTPEPQHDSQSTPPDQLDTTSQRSWYYYLAEIASRRLANRIAYALHVMRPPNWLNMPIKGLERLATELDAQVLQWSEHVPTSIALADWTSEDELTLLLQARYLDMRERISRPFLYIAIHIDQAKIETLDVPVLPRARDCIDLALQYINRVGIRHRHHGSWYAARQLFSKALLVLAAVKRGVIDAHTDWINSLDLVQTCLGYWEGEAPDLRVARLALIDILAGVRTSATRA